MEQEALFLYASYVRYELPAKYEGSFDIRPFFFEFKRASMQRRPRSGEYYERVPIEFDPLSKQLCYAVVCLCNKIEGSCLRIENIPHFACIEQDEKEALQKKEEIENGGFKEYLGEKETFAKCEVITALITPD